MTTTVDLRIVIHEEPAQRAYGEYLRDYAAESTSDAPPQTWMQWFTDWVTGIVDDVTASGSDEPGATHRVEYGGGPA